MFACSTPMASHRPTPWRGPLAQAKDGRTLTDVKWFPLYNSADATEHAPSVRVKSSDNGTLVEVQPSSQLEAGEEELRGWLLDASAIKAPLQQLILDWTSERDGFQRFTIEASDDLQNWQSWGEGQVARLTFADERVEQHEVGLPGQSARYLRLLWETPQSAPILTSAQLQSSRSLPLPLVWSQALAGSSVKAGEYTWQLPMGVNVERVQVELSQPNSLAPVMLSGRRDSSLPWQPLSSGLLYRLTQSGQDVVQDQLQLSGQTVQQLKLTVDERGGGLGAQAPFVKFAVRATHLVFLARGPSAVYPGAGQYDREGSKPAFVDADTGLQRGETGDTGQSCGGWRGGDTYGCDSAGDGGHRLEEIRPVGGAVAQRAVPGGDGLQSVAQTAGQTLKSGCCAPSQVASSHRYCGVPVEAGLSAMASELTLNYRNCPLSVPHIRPISISLNPAHELSLADHV